MANLDPAAHDDRRQTPTTSIPRYQWLYFAALLLPAVLFGVAGFLLRESEFAALGTTWNSGYIMYTYGVVFYIATMFMGYRTVPSNEIGGVYFLGYATVMLRGQFVILVPGMKLETRTAEVLQIELPTDPEKVYRADRDKGDPASVPADLAAQGFRPPIRVIFSDQKNDAYYDALGHSLGIKLDVAGVKNEDPLHRRSTNEVALYLRQQIRDIFDFIGNIGTPEKANQQLEDTAVSFTQSILGKLTPAIALQNLDQVSVALFERMVLHTQNWGTALLTAEVKAIETSHHLNSDLQSIPRSLARAEAERRLSEGTRDAAINEGTGKAEANRIRIVKEGEGEAARAASLGLSGAAILAADTARSVGEAPSTKILLGPEALTSLVGIAGVALDTLKEKKGDAPAPTEHAMG